MPAGPEVISVAADWLMTAARVGGSFMVICAGGLTGFAFAGRLDAELAELDRLETALITLSSEVSYALQPLPAALMSAGTRAGGSIGALLYRMGSLTGLSQRRTPTEALEQALDPDMDQALRRTSGLASGPALAGTLDQAAGRATGRAAPGAVLSAFELDLLRDLARNLGVSGHKEQLRYIEMSIDRVRDRRASFAAECRRKAKLYRYLGIAAGASVAIVLM